MDRISSRCFAISRRAARAKTSCNRRAGWPTAPLLPRPDLLAKISHEIRTPLNAIIGFAEVMLGERFGALGNERYLEYMKDIRSSGERVTTMINDLLELSRIETGKLNLAFTSQISTSWWRAASRMMQLQANRDRIIIRTSLAQACRPWWPTPGPCARSRST